MADFFPNDSVIHISDGLIEDIRSENNTTFVTISYTDCAACRIPEQTVRLVVSSRTRIYDENGNRIPVSTLNVGMIIDAAFSNAMTRSIPPQASAFLIRIVRRPVSGNITTGRILDVDRQSRSFTALSDGNLSSIIRFNVARDALILDRAGRPIHFSRLIPGLRVRIRHAAFMTASILPQTTAFEIRVL